MLNLSRRAVATVLWSTSHPAPFLEHHLEICPKIPVSMEECPVLLPSLLPAFAVSGARQCPCPAAWDQAATNSSGKEEKLVDVTPERGCSTGLPLKITQSSPWTIPQLFPSFPAHSSGCTALFGLWARLGSAGREFY